MITIEELEEKFVDYERRISRFPNFQLSWNFGGFCSGISEFFCNFSNFRRTS